MSEVIRELTAIKKLIKLQSTQLGKMSSGAKSSKVLHEATKKIEESTKFNTIRNAVKQNHNTQM